MFPMVIFNVKDMILPGSIAFKIPPPGPRGSAYPLSVPSFILVSAHCLAAGHKTRFLYDKIKFWCIC